MPDYVPEPVKPYDRYAHAKLATGYTCACGGHLQKFRGTTMLTCERCGEAFWLTPRTSSPEPAGGN